MRDADRSALELPPLIQLDPAMTRARFADGKSLARDCPLCRAPLRQVASEPYVVGACGHCGATVLRETAGAWPAPRAPALADTSPLRWSGALVLAVALPIVSAALARAVAGGLFRELFDAGPSLQRSDVAAVLLGALFGAPLAALLGGFLLGRRPLRAAAIAALATGVSAALVWVGASASDKLVAMAAVLPVLSLALAAASSFGTLGVARALTWGLRAALLCVVIAGTGTVAWRAWIARRDAGCPEGAARVVTGAGVYCMKDGKREGIGERVVGGHAIEKATFHADVKEGPAWEYQPDGSVRAEGTYAADEKHGAWLVFDGAGKLEAKGAYVRGLEAGEWTLIDGAGTHVGAFRAGKRVGEWVTTAANGSSKRETLAP